MKTFLSPVRKSSRLSIRAKRLRFLGIASLCAAAIYFVLPVIFRWLFGFILLPFLFLEQWYIDSPQALPMYFKDRAVLVADINTLQAEIASKETIPEETARIIEENSTLRALLGDDQEPRLLAGVSIRPPLLPYDTLMIDKGRSSGVEVGVPVFAGKNVIIGLVQGVYERSSIVGLISSPGVQSTVFIGGPNIYTTAEGIGGGGLVIGVPQEILLSEGDPVIMPGFSGEVFGEISSIVKNPTDAEQYAFITAPINLQAVQYVAVGSEPLPAIDFETAKEVVANSDFKAAQVPVPEGVLVELTSTTTTATSSSSTIESI